MLTTGPRGTNDILPQEVGKWQILEEKIRSWCERYHFGEIRTPIFEHTELFLRGVGETTDIVEKEMYTFTDRGDRSITLRPEGTASTVRAFLQHKLAGQAPLQKLYYMGPMFRYDRPQAGRYRQFHQFGVEMLGSAEAVADAEVIVIALDILKELGLNDLEVHINSIGCPQCRQVHREKLVEFLGDRLSELCPDCASRFERNPLRILDCKNKKCQAIVSDAPAVMTCLCDDCRAHFEKLQSYLQKLNIKYEVDTNLVRGLDYYTKTVFEIMYSGLGAQSTVCGGGRYDGLVEECGGPSTPAVGFAMGLERVLLTLEKMGIQLAVPQGIDIFIASMGDEAQKEAFLLLHECRAHGLKGEMDYRKRSLKAQMKQANKLGAEKVVILGEEELNKGQAVVRMMETGEQLEVELSQLIETLEK